jgi:hypothetical protein
MPSVEVSFDGGISEDSTHPQMSGGEISECSTHKFKQMVWFDGSIGYVSVGTHPRVRHLRSADEPIDKARKQAHTDRSTDRQTCHLCPPPPSILRRLRTHGHAGRQAGRQAGRFTRSHTVAHMRARTVTRAPVTHTGADKHARLHQLTHGSLRRDDVREGSQLTHGSRHRDDVREGSRKLSGTRKQPLSGPLQLS